MVLNFSNRTGLFFILFILAACNKASDKTEDGALSEVNVKGESGARVPFDNVENRPLESMNLVHDYKNSAPDSKMDNWLLLSKSSQAEESRNIFDNEISNSNYIFQNRMIYEYISLGKNEKIPRHIRRKYVIDALWLWQRLPPKIDEWSITSSKIPDNYSGDLNSQNRLQDIIITLRNLEKE